MKNVTAKELALLAPPDVYYGILRYGDDFNQKIKFRYISEIDKKVFVFTSCIF